jgi:hypothetical protein
MREFRKSGSPRIVSDLLASDTKRHFFYWGPRALGEVVGCTSAISARWRVFATLPKLVAALRAHDAVLDHAHRVKNKQKVA